MTGLVLEGGAMRGMYTVGVLDAMMDSGIGVDGIIGVSAGAAFGVNYKSHQKGRALRYNMKYGQDKRYCGIGSFIKTGNYFSKDFAYHVVPTELDIFDGETFRHDPTRFWLVCTDVRTGGPVYHELTDVSYETLEWIRASASLPVLSSIVNLDGRGLLDGGISDSIPLKRFQEMGYERNIVILTQPRDYKKTPLKPMWLFSMALKKYPKLVDALRYRHDMYNRQLEYISQEESKGNTLVICPEKTLPIRRTEMDPEKMRLVHQIGYHSAEDNMDRIKEFLSRR